jgi:DNA polymerase III subunit alpha
VDPHKVNRKVVEALVKSGAFDGVATRRNATRSKMFFAIPAASEAAAAALRDRETGQTSLLALFSGAPAGAAPTPVDDVYGDGVEWTPKERLAFEKESLGFYISGHPLDRFGGELKRFANANTANCVERGPRAEVTLGGVVCDFQERMAKSGTGKYAFFKLEDQYGQIEVQVGNQKLGDFRLTLTSGEPLLVNAMVDTPFGDGETARERLRFIDARPLASIRAERSSLMDIRLNADRLTDDSLGVLHRLLRQFPGPCRTRLRLEIPQRSETVLDLTEEFNVAASEELLMRLEQMFGERVAVLR